MLSNASRLLKQEVRVANASGFALKQAKKRRSFSNFECGDFYFVILHLSVIYSGNPSLV